MHEYTPGRYDYHEDGERVCGECGARKGAAQHRVQRPAPARRRLSVYDLDRMLQSSPHSEGLPS